MVKWYFDYLTHRNINIELHGEKISASIGVGFPQGGVASAKFWLIAFDEAVGIINSHGVTGHAFADDCAALVGGTHVAHLRNKLQKVLNDLTSWGNTCGLRFNQQKYIAVHFTRRRKDPPAPLIIDGNPVVYEKTVKYLGVTMDSKLHWQVHVENKVKQAKRQLFALNSIVTKTWGPKPALIRWVYTGMVRPALSYASVNWAHEVQTGRVIKK